ncbi:hypothetical protein VB005_00002 [Metarhizium brunneum]
MPPGKKISQCRSVRPWVGFDKVIKPFMIYEDAMENRHRITRR